MGHEECQKGQEIPKKGGEDFEGKVIKNYGKWKKHVSVWLYGKLSNFINFKKKYENMTIFLNFENILLH